MVTNKPVIARRTHFNTSRRAGPAVGSLDVQAFKEHAEAQQALIASKRAHEAVAAAVATISSSGVSALGLMKLQKLLLSDNQLSGTLPAKYANLEQLKVG